MYVTSMEPTTLRVMTKRWVISRKQNAYHLFIIFSDIWFSICLITYQHIYGLTLSYVYYMKQFKHKLASSLLARTTITLITQDHKTAQLYLHMSGDGNISLVQFNKGFSMVFIRCPLYLRSRSNNIHVNRKSMRGVFSMRNICQDLSNQVTHAKPTWNCLIFSG